MAIATLSLRQTGTVIAVGIHAALWIPVPHEGIGGLHAVGPNGKPTHKEKNSSDKICVIDSATFIQARSELQAIYCSAVLLKTDGLPAPCAFRTDLPQYADHVFWAEWASHCREAVEHQKVLCDYRLHSSNETSRNRKNLQSGLLDELKTMEAIFPLLKKNGFAAWLHREKQKSIFAARSQVKIRQIRAADPELAEDVRKLAREHSTALHWFLGKFAVGLRDILH